MPTDKTFFYPEGIEGLSKYILRSICLRFRRHLRDGGPAGAAASCARIIPDRDRDEWVRFENASNPLPICTRPQVLRNVRRTC